METAQRNSESVATAAAGMPPLEPSRRSVDVVSMAKQCLSPVSVGIPTAMIDKKRSIEQEQRELIACRTKQPIAKRSVPPPLPLSLGGNSSAQSVLPRDAVTLPPITPPLSAPAGRTSKAITVTSLVSSAPIQAPTLCSPPKSTSSLEYTQARTPTLRSPPVHGSPMSGISTLSHGPTRQSSQSGLQMSGRGGGSPAAVSEAAQSPCQATTVKQLTGPRSECQTAPASSSGTPTTSIGSKRPYSKRCSFADHRRPGRRPAGLDMNALRRERQFSGPYSANPLLLRKRRNRDGTNESDCDESDSQEARVKPRDSVDISPKSVHLPEIATMTAAFRPSSQPTSQPSETDALSPRTRLPLPSLVEVGLGRSARLPDPTIRPASSPAQHKETSKKKRQRFLALCAEAWDLLHDED